MKKKILSSIIVMMLSVITVFSLSSHVTTDEEARKREPEGNGCGYYCWYRDSQGNWYSIVHTGTLISCPRVEYPHDCSPQECQPLIPC